MALKRHLLSISAAAGVASAGLALVGPAHVLAGYGYSMICGDNNSAANWTGQYAQADDIPIVGGPYSLDPSSPATLGVEISDNNGVHVAVCYATSSYGSTGGEAAGGAITVDALETPGVVWSNPTGNPAQVGCEPDSVPQGATVSCEVGSSPTYSVSPGPAGTTGDIITVNIPFTVCFGGCTGSAAALNPTGLLVGQLSPVPQPGIGFGYTLTSLDVYVDGALVFSEVPTTVAGAYVDPFGAVEESLNFQQGGPCSSGICVPQGYVGTTGKNLVGFTVLGFPFNYAPPKECPYYNPNTSYCP